MATDEETVFLSEPPEAALQTCVTALTRAGFKNISANRDALLVTASKRPFGQWTKSQMTLALREYESGTHVTLVSQAAAQSLGSLMSNPAQALVDAAVTELKLTKAGAEASPRRNHHGRMVTPTGHPLDPDSYSDEDRPFGRYIIPESPWKMRSWGEQGWASKTTKTPKRDLDGWSKIA